MSLIIKAEKAIDLLKTKYLMKCKQSTYRKRCGIFN